MIRTTLGIVGLTVLVLAAAPPAAEARKEKTVICHVGNEAGSGGEVYLDDPDCVPSEENSYFCPDAGKIDLISVANANKHLNNPSHAWDGVSDYLPADIGASGEGNEDTNGDGIDDGCEPPASACPCWDEEELLAVTAGNLNTEFDACVPLYPGFLGIGTDDFSVFFEADSGSASGARCAAAGFNPNSVSPGTCDESGGECTGESLPLDPAVAEICLQQIIDRCAEITPP